MEGGHPQRCVLIRESIRFRESHFPQPGRWGNRNPPAKDTENEENHEPHGPFPSLPFNPEAVTALFAELIIVATTNSKFEAFPPGRVLEPANILVRNGISTIEAFRATDDTARKYLPDDYRETERLPYAHLYFMFELSRHIPLKLRKLPMGTFVSPSLESPEL